jgi:hypothetical protein
MPQHRNEGLNPLFSACDEIDGALPASANVASRSCSAQTDGLMQAQRDEFEESANCDTIEGTNRILERLLELEEQATIQLDPFGRAFGLLESFEATFQQFPVASGVCRGSFAAAKPSAQLGSQCLHAEDRFAFASTRLRV